ncbi:hypothetical protein C8F04DRAFT_1389007 [Mycena alexandri]|uniref:Uncharacterized protein n=1 Tax=Mycena alexandri TaxID=1745969 RepID=A0AAD6TEF5_9AGAR|nr:hypothetical protein C8F04DRAFT_1389007 [Mycena alexandri]
MGSHGELGRFSLPPPVPHRPAIPAGHVCPVCGEHDTIRPHHYLHGADSIHHSAKIKRCELWGLPISTPRYVASFELGFLRVRCVFGCVVLGLAARPSSSSASRRSTFAPTPPAWHPTPTGNHSPTLATRERRPHGRRLASTRADKAKTPARHYRPRHLHGPHLGPHPPFPLP